MRTTARTTNLAVILLGAGLFALLGYSLTTELFSKNSPTVLYGDACERIKASSKVCFSSVLIYSSLIVRRSQSIFPDRCPFTTALLQRFGLGTVTVMSFPKSWLMHTDKSI